MVDRDELLGVSIYLKLALASRIHSVGHTDVDFDDAIVLGKAGISVEHSGSGAHINSR